MGHMTARKKYFLLQVPGWIVVGALVGGLQHWEVIPLWASVLLFLLYVGKDFVLYPYLRHAYESDVKTGVEQLEGAIGVVQKTLDPEGYVQIHGELWQAVAEPPAAAVPAGCRVRVQGAQGLTLRVVALPPDPEAPSAASPPPSGGGRKFSLE